ncbi:MAG TPA: Hsp70 family protein [Sedimentisphaerales bacterium]|jgi:molecular chaperone DnaK|nr:Hsp70 family protein [Sedimentisphaerales bacterium]HNU29352.1 Hsp70 family protein [Sedimentisphaerales bacterium]
MSNIVGIDLGTTFSSLAMLNAIGKPEIVPNADGDRLTPSAIFFDEDDGGVIRVGVEALNSRHLNASRSVRWVKRHMGDPDFKVSIDGKDWTATELSSLILRKLRQDGAAQAGEMHDAVISVPAHFDEIRRKATMDAGTAAGFNVIGIVNEPVAAALCYATTKNVAGRVLVYDLGGGTFDVTLMNVKGLDMEILCSQGDHALGGIDFDRTVLELLQKMYREKFNADLIATEEDRAKYEDEAEDIKKTLSRRPVAKTMLYGPAGSMRGEVSREMFEQGITPLVSRADMLVEVVLDEAGIKPSDVTTVLLVGGSTRVPLIRAHLEGIFGFPPECSINVDECVALGAALHAGITKLRQNPDDVATGIREGLKDISLTDVCNHSYGTICAPIDKETGRRVVQNRIILKKNTPLPCEISQTFYTVSEGQKRVEVTITQGEDADPAYVNRIATHSLELPPDRPAERPIQVTYSYDLNQRMHCAFRDVESGRLLELDFSMDENDAEGANEKATAQLEPFKVQ